MAALIDKTRAGGLGWGRTVVFLHTGERPNLFYYGQELGGKKWRWWEDWGCFRCPPTPFPSQRG